MIKRTTLDEGPFVFRISEAEAGDTANLTSDGIDVKFTMVNGVWTAPDNKKAFHPSENMIALPHCTQIFVGKPNESATVTLDDEVITKFGGDGGYYYMNKRLMPAKFNDAGTVITFWHKDKVEMSNRTIHNLAATKSITISPGETQQKYIIVGGGTGQIGDEEFTAIRVIPVDQDITYKAIKYSILMEIEI
jgi:hypothetical protein